jgi:TolA-binding protein
MMTKYAFEVLIRTSEGDMTPPGFAGDVLSANYGLVFKQVGIYMIFGAMIGTLFAKDMTVLATMASILVLLFMPAMTMVLASTNSLMAAINPLYLLGMVTRVGWSYLGLYGLLFIVFVAESNMQGLLLPRVGEDLILPIYTAINLFFSVLAYHMMGYLLYQNHETLGIDQRISNDNDDEQDITESKLDMFYSYMDQNMLDAAKAELFGQAKDNPADTKLQQKACTFLMAHGEDEEKLKYARNIIPILLETERGNIAANMYLDLVAKNPKFSLKQAAHYLELSRALYTMGRDKVALNLVRNLHKRFPDSIETADIYIEAAEVLSHKLGRDDMALKMLIFVTKSFPKHPRRHETLQLIKTIRKVATA